MRFGSGVPVVSKKQSIVTLSWKHISCIFRKVFFSHFKVDGKVQQLHLKSTLAERLMYFHRSNNSFDGFPSKNSGV